MPLGSSSATPVIRPGPQRASGCSLIRDQSVVRVAILASALRIARSASAVTVQDRPECFAMSGLVVSRRRLSGRSTGINITAVLKRIHDVFEVRGVIQAEGVACFVDKRQEDDCVTKQRISLVSCVGAGQDKNLCTLLAIHIHRTCFAVETRV